MGTTAGLVVDDHTYMRSAMTAALTEVGVSPVHTAASLSEGRELLLSVRPLIAVLDLNLDDGSSFGLITSLHQQGTRTLALTSADDAYTVRAAHAAGVLGYLLKSAPHETVLQGLREVLAGRRYFDPAVARVLGEQAGPASDAPVELSLREVSLLQHVAEGLGNVEIAERLGTDPLSVKSQLTQIGRKLGTQDREGMLAAARKLDVLL